MKNLVYNNIHCPFFTKNVVVEILTLPKNIFQLSDGDQNLYIIITMS